MWFTSQPILHPNAPWSRVELSRADRGQIVFSMRKKRPSIRLTFFPSPLSDRLQTIFIRRNCDRHFRQSSLHAPPSPFPLVQFFQTCNAVQREREVVTLETEEGEGGARHKRIIRRRQWLDWPLSTGVWNNIDLRAFNSVNTKNGYWRLVWDTSISLQDPSSY